MGHRILQGAPAGQGNLWGVPGGQGLLLGGLAGWRLLLGAGRGLLEGAPAGQGSSLELRLSGRAGAPSGVAGGGYGGLSRCFAHQWVKRLRRTNIARQYCVMSRREVVRFHKFFGQD